VPSMYKQGGKSSIKDGNPDNTPRISGKRSAGKGRSANYRHPRFLGIALSNDEP
jgi:hypothetical protein